MPKFSFMKGTAMGKAITTRRAESHSFDFSKRDETKELSPVPESF
jgi:hypothetical protein